MTTRRTALARLALTAGVTAALAACSSGPALPPVQWVRLPADPPAPVRPQAQSPTQVWQLVLPVTLPGHLERDALLVPQGQAGLQPLAGVRWAEPLRDAVPRLLAQDLGARLGVPIWVSPLPPGLAPTRQLRVELLQLDVTDGRAGVALHARWSIAQPGGSAPPQTGQTRFVQPAAATDAASLALAHRAALARLAQAIAP